MTRDDIIRMARDCGVDTEADTLTCYGGFAEVFEQFAALVAAAEREACARLVDLEAKLLGQELRSASAIRARGQQ